MNAVKVAVSIRARSPQQNKTKEMVGMGTAIGSQGSQQYGDVGCTVKCATKPLLDHEIDSLYSSVSDIETVIHKLAAIVTVPQVESPVDPAPARSGIAPLAIMDARLHLQALMKKLDILADRLAEVIGGYKLLNG